MTTIKRNLQESLQSDCFGNVLILQSSPCSCLTDPLLKLQPLPKT